MTAAPETSHDLIVQSARAALDLQHHNGSFPPGRAGAYNIPLTPVRTTANWLVTITKAFEITDENIFIDPIYDSIDYLLRDDLRPDGYTFQARKSKQKNKCDGLVGQAAPIRGLAYAGNVFDHEAALSTAKSIFEIHPFNNRLGLWECVEIDGTHLSFDRTLNHQIIFAGSAIPLAKRFDSVTETCVSFIDNLNKNIKTHRDGLPRHYVQPDISTYLPVIATSFRHWPLLWNEVAIHYHSYTTQRREKEIGYYPVIMAELARLKHNWPNHDFWTSEKLTQILSFHNSKDYERVLDGDLSQGSVIPWLDHTTIAWAFLDPTYDNLSTYLTNAVSRCYDFDTGLFTDSTTDPEFQATAITDLVSLPKIRLQNDHFDDQ